MISLTARQVSQRLPHAENEGVNELLTLLPIRLPAPIEAPESLLVSTRPHSLSLNSGVPGTTENAFSDGQALKVPHRGGRRANKPPPCSLLATVKRDIGRPVACVVCLAISPLSAACFFWPFEIVSKVVKRCCEQFELCSHTCHTAAFLQLPNDSTSGKASRCRLTD
ncbi:hypothetical protein TNCV_178471 [Trichonephila clavipes]|nr:hypothetical protein TNCV_178471 [Trichonephila clavipes]